MYGKESSMVSTCSVVSEWIDFSEVQVLSLVLISVVFEALGEETGVFVIVCVGLLSDVLTVFFTFVGFVMLVVVVPRPWANRK